MHKKVYGLIFPLLPVLIGGLLYICFRNENILLFSWIRFVNIDYSFLRHIVIADNLISSYIIYSLPNGLWVLSGLLLLKYFLKNENRVYLFYATVFILISISIEVCQLYGIVPGTFDILDLVTIIIFSIIGFLMNTEWKKYEKT